jgi:hypothetical protein
MVRAAVVAKALGVSQRTLLNWARDRGFPRPDYGKLFLDDVRCWLESQRAKAEAAHVG